MYITVNKYVYVIFIINRKRTEIQKLIMLNLTPVNCFFKSFHVHTEIIDCLLKKGDDNYYTLSYYTYTSKQN